MELYVVGGYVRDFLLGKPATDIDIVVVGSSVDEMISLGYQQVGADFPVFLSSNPNNTIQYALARTERKIGEGYTGFECDISNVTLKQDLQRRDLTINALAMEVTHHTHHCDDTDIWIDTTKIFDYFGGCEDLRQGVLKHIEVDGETAFDEDPVRMLRVARFAVKYYNHMFIIAPSTKQLLQKMYNNGDYNHLVPERVGMEVIKAIESCSNVADFMAFVSTVQQCTNNMFFDLLPQTYKLLPRYLEQYNTVTAQSFILAAFGFTKDQCELLKLTNDHISLVDAIHKCNLLVDAHFDRLNLMQLLAAFGRSSRMFESLCWYLNLFSNTAKTAMLLQHINKITPNTLLHTSPLLYEWIMNGEGKQRKDRLDELRKTAINNFKAYGEMYEIFNGSPKT